MKKQEIPEGATAIVTYVWDPVRGDYILAKREPVKQDNADQADQAEETTA